MNPKQTPAEAAAELQTPQRPTPSTDIYQRVTDRILADLEAGVKPWVKPWVSGSPSIPLRSTGQPYQGINVLILWCIADEKGYTSPFWLTFKQAIELGGNVRKGEKSAPVVYATKLEKENAETGDTDSIFFMRHFNVFNAQQCDNLPDHFKPQTHNVHGPSPERLPEVEKFFRETGARIEHGGARAYYRPADDLIQMPHLADFHDQFGYYGTLSHELIHWTSPEHRANRVLGKRFGDSAYALEELVAELGSAYLCAMLGIEPELEPRPDHASYIERWLAVLKHDKRAIFTAAAAAQRAVNFLCKKEVSEGE